MCSLLLASNLSETLIGQVGETQPMLVACNHDNGTGVGTSGVMEESNLDISQTETITIGVTLSVVLVVSLIANTCVFLVFCQRKVISISNRFVLNLTICNCLNTVLFIPFALASLIAKQWVFGSFLCVYTGFMNNALVSASIFTLAVISIDRYCAVVTPLHYSMRLTSLRCAVLVVCIWSAAILISTPPLLGWNSIEFQQDKMVCTVKWSSSGKHDSSYTFFLISFSFLLPLIAILWTYSRIFRAVHGNIVRTRRNSIIRGSSSANGHCGNNSTNGQSDESAQQTPPLNFRRRGSSIPIIRRLSQSSNRPSSLLWRKEEWKAAVTSFLVLFSFAVCWTPYFVVMAVEAGRNSSSPVPAVVSQVSTVLAMFSHACNPLVYVFRSKLVRKELAIIFRGQVCPEPGVCVPHDVTRRASGSVFRNDSVKSRDSLAKMSGRRY